MLENLVTLALLTLLQAVLGFDNLLYISLESRRAPADRQAMVRRLGIGLAMVLRILLLFALIRVIDRFQAPLLHLDHAFVSGEFHLHSLVVLLGGAFILYTATREILHMMALEEEDHEDSGGRPVARIIASIVAMNLVFSFDSILSAMALSRVFWVMATAIVIGAALMILLADRVSEFLKRNRMYEVLGLFVLFVVGIMLLTEGGHLAHLHLFGHEITAMSKATFYFVVGVLVLTDLVQARYQRRLRRLKEKMAA
ncbi:MAG TPA: tellurium resistance protein TerC [bacterium]|nr:tellurium resistance protein TerC [bacterium]